MVQKARIRNEHRFAFRDGELSEIPEDALKLLRELYPSEEGQNKAQETKPKTKKDKDSE